MASPTTKESAPAPMMAAGTENPPPAPVQGPMLPDDIDPVLLLRLFAGKFDASGAKSAAIAQGKATAAAGLKLLASQQEPVVSHA